MLWVLMSQKFLKTKNNILWEVTVSKSFKFGDEELVFEGNPGLFMKAKDIYNKCVDGYSDELDDLLEKFWDVVGHTYNHCDGRLLRIR